MSIILIIKIQNVNSQTALNFDCELCNRSGFDKEAVFPLG